jgi:hypothetical protein
MSSGGPRSPLTDPRCGQGLVYRCVEQGEAEATRLHSALAQSPQWTTLTVRLQGHQPGGGVVLQRAGLPGPQLCFLPGFPELPCTIYKLPFPASSEWVSLCTWS